MNSRNRLEYDELITGRNYWSLSWVGSGFFLIGGVAVLIAKDHIEGDWRSVIIVGTSGILTAVMCFVGGLIGGTYGTMMALLTQRNADHMSTDFERVRRWVFSDRLSSLLKVTPWVALGGLVISLFAIQYAGGGEFISVFVGMTLLMTTAVIKLGHMWICLARRLIERIDQLESTD